MNALHLIILVLSIALAFLIHDKLRDDLENRILALERRDLGEKPDVVDEIRVELINNRLHSIVVYWDPTFEFTADRDPSDLVERFSVGPRKRKAFASRLGHSFYFRDAHFDESQNKRVEGPLLPYRFVVNGPESFPVDPDWEAREAEEERLRASERETQERIVASS